MKLIYTAAALLGIFGVALLAAPAQALPALPSQCPGVIGDYNVIDRSNVASAIVTGTSGADFIKLRNGIVYAGDGNDCILFAGGPTVNATTGIAFGEAGNDVIIRPSTGSLSGQAYGDYQIQYPVYTWEPENCDPDVDFPCDQVAFSLPEGNADRCIGKWAYKQGCELN